MGLKATGQSKTHGTLPEDTSPGLSRRSLCPVRLEQNFVRLSRHGCPAEQKLAGLSRPIPVPEILPCGLIKF